MLADEDAVLISTPRICSDQATAAPGTVDEYLQCAIGQDESDWYFYGGKTLPDDVYEGLLDTCSDARGLESSRTYCAEIFPQTLINGADPILDERLFQKVSESQLKECLSEVSFPVTTVHDFIECAIGDAKAVQYSQGDIRLSDDLHGEVLGVCMIDSPLRDCLATFPLQGLSRKLFSR